MNKSETRRLIRASIEEDNLNQLAEFKVLGQEKGHYTKTQKEYAVCKAKSICIRTTSRLLRLQRRTIQRWLILL